MRRVASKDSLPRAEVFAPRNAEESMLMYGKTGLEFAATDAAPGSVDKVAILAYRVEMGLPLWHPEDRKGYEGVNNYVEPKDPWGIPGFEVDEIHDTDYEMEAELPEELR